MAEQTLTGQPAERRSENRQSAKDCYRAELRLVGVPVHEVKLKDLSSKGACILFKDSSSLLNHLQVRQTVMVKFFTNFNVKIL